MGDRLRAGKLSRYVTSHQGQLSLAIPPWVGAMSTSLGWECNHRSGIALDMRHKQYNVVYPPTGSTAYEREMSTPPTLLLEYGPPFSFTYNQRHQFLHAPQHDTYTQQCSDEQKLSI